MTRPTSSTPGSRPWWGTVKPRRDELWEPQPPFYLASQSPAGLYRPHDDAQAMPLLAEAIKVQLKLTLATRHSVTHKGESMIGWRIDLADAIADVIGMTWVWPTATMFWYSPWLVQNVLPNLDEIEPHVMWAIEASLAGDFDDVHKKDRSWFINTHKRNPEN